MNTRIIGIDLGVTASHQAAILDLATHTFVSHPHKFSPTVKQMDKLIQRAKQEASEDTELIAVLEATGMAWYPVGVYLHDHGVKVYRVNGRATRDLRKVFALHAASDRIDCRVLAQLYGVSLVVQPAFEPPSGDQLALQRACREFVRLREADVAAQNRLASYDPWAWRGLSRLIPANALPWMREHWYDPWRVCAAGETALCEAWAAASRPPADVSWIPAWVRRAQEMTQLYGSVSRVNYSELQLSIRRELHFRQYTQDLRADLREHHIQPLYRKLYPDRWLESLVGVGPDSAAIYMAFIQDINRFPTVAQFRSWCGIVPTSHQSGTGESKGNHLTHAGPNLVKATLFLNADIARRYDVQFAVLYYRQMVDYGKHHFQAVCACASHLANRIYALLKEQRPYELRDLHNRPISPQVSRQLCLEKYHVSEDVRKRTRTRPRKERINLRSEQRFRQHLAS